jgi:pimeloyl-ACP methyl ester carboxylesterase
MNELPNWQIERPSPDRSPIAGEWVREGDYWTVRFGERELRIRDSKGIRYLAELLNRPDTELAALELQAVGTGPTPRVPVDREAELREEADLGPVLDARAKAQYRERLTALEAERQEAEAFRDPERAARARSEYEQLANELAVAVGHGSRDRRTGSPEERARVNVTRAIKTAIRSIGRYDRALGDHLGSAIITGRLCVYRPRRSQPPQWRVQTRQAAPASTPFTPPQTQYAQANGASIAYQVLGEGDQDIVFVPGVISHLDLLWEDDVTSTFFRRLAKLGRLILFDKRDTGLSDSSNADATLEERIDDVQAVMAASDCDHVVLFGFSEGGPMSIVFAASHPERVRALILGAAAARWPSAPEYPCGRESDEAIDALEHIARYRWGMGDTTELFLPSRANSIHTRRLMARYERMSASPTAFLRMLQLIRQIDVRPLLPSIRVPTLVIQRLQDRVTPRFHGRYLAEHIPDCRYFEQPGDHSLRFASSGDTDTLLDEVKDFLASIEAPREPHPVLATILVALPADAGDPPGDDPTMNTAFSRHVQAHRGRLIHSTPDLTVATFDGPGRALRCAAALRDIADRQGIELRVGVHTGEIESAGDTIVGRTSDVAQRAAAAAHPGEILATQVVRDLVARVRDEIPRARHEYRRQPPRIASPVRSARRLRAPGAIATASAAHISPPRSNGLAAARSPPPGPRHTKRPAGPTDRRSGRRARG